MPIPLSIRASARLKLSKSSNIGRVIRQAVYRKLNRASLSAQVSALNYMRKAVRQCIIESDTYTSLISHDTESLKAHFGLPNPEERLGEIIDSFIDSFYIDKRKGFFATRVGGSPVLKSGFVIVFKPTGGWHMLTALHAATLNTDKGDSLPWLEWLLLRGDDRALVAGYEFEARTGKYKGWNSRTGLAVMVKRPTGRWGVPREYTGTTNKNFLTKSVHKALQDSNDVLIHILRTTFIRTLNHA